MRSTISTRITSFTTGFSTSSCRASCVMFFQECSRLVSPVMAMIGMPALKDSASAVVEIGGAGAERGVDDAGPVGHPRIGIGGKGAAALVVDERVPEPEDAAGLVERQQLEAAHAEQRPHFVELQHLCRAHGRRSSTGLRCSLLRERRDMSVS